jgi:hypothetical protein
MLTREMPLGRWRVSSLVAHLEFMKPGVTEATAEQVCQYLCSSGDLKKERNFCVTF